MDAIHTHADHPWLPERDIEVRLAELAARYPASILLELDNEGRAYLETALEGHQGDILWTDNGGGELTKMHWEVVLDHIGFAEIILWFDVPEDAGLVRAACADVERMKSN
ncbi:hypothetical protein [Paramagnetospirillum caucaseum]|nr:hypothetical protein [Paramagnetospirillum caucaseum]